MSTLILLLFGFVVGSFLNVVAERYDEKSSLFSTKNIGGRSFCPSCRRTLRWFELIPVISFILQKGRCRRCHAPIAVSCLVSELVAGAIFALVPCRVATLFSVYSEVILPLQILWVVLFLTLLLLSLVDARLSLIPDEANICIAILGIFITLLTPSPIFGGAFSFVGPYALFFGGQSSPLISHALSLIFAALLFGGLIVATRGRGMGVGDLKLVVALAFVFGWPDNFLISLLAFIIGALTSIIFIASNKKTLKSSLSFGPFIAASCAVLFFCGERMLAFYFGIFQ